MFDTSVFILKPLRLDGRGGVQPQSPMSLPNCRSFFRIALSVAAACAFFAAGALAAPTAGREPAPESGGLNLRPSRDEVRYLGHAVAPGQYIGRLKAKVVADSTLASALAAQTPAVVGAESVQHIKSRRLALLKPKSAKVAALRAANATERQRTVKADIDALMATGLYDYVEPDYIQYATAVPSDASFVDGTLWGLRNSGQNGGLSGADINAVAAWELTTGSTHVVVGVIDTGIRYTHQDLAAQMWVNAGEIPGDGIDNDNNGYVDDIHGINAITGTGDPMDDHNHGTHCAGTIGASANDAGPIVGVAWNVRLMGLKFLNSGGFGDTSHAIKCIEYALSKGVRILSNSWGDGGPSQALEDAIKAARDQGCLFLAAAGNGGVDADRTDFYPACYKLDNVVSIGALDRRDNLARFTNTGLSTVDLAAPGVDVYSSIASDDSAYANFSGTSMATPHVAGVAALVLAQYPGISMAELRQRLIASTREVAALRGYSWSGGAVDAYRALTITADGILDVRSSAGLMPLRAGHQESLFLTVMDLAPVLGATVTGTLAGVPLTFLDDGAAPDRVAGDGVYSVWANTPTGVTETTLEAAIIRAGKAPYAGTFTYPVGIAPKNDDFAAAIAVPAGVLSVNGSNVNAGEESGEPVHAGAGAGRSVWWTWTAPASGVAVIGTSGSAFSPAVGIYTGSSVSSLTPVGSNLDGTGYRRPTASFVVTAGTTYRIAVDSVGRTQGSILLSFPVSVVPLPTNDNFANATALAGPNGLAVGTNLTATKETGEPNHAGKTGIGSVWWTWTAPISGQYHWSTSGSTFNTLLAVYTGDAVGALTEIASNNESNSGSTSELTFAAVAGTTYRIAVDGRYGSRGIVQLAFAAVAAPENDNLADAIALSGATGSITGTNRFATGELGEPIHINSNATATSVWYSWTAAADGYQEFDTDGSGFDTALAVYTGGAVSALTAVVSDDNNGAGSCSRVVVPSSAGTTYRIALGDASYNRRGGAYVLNRRQVFAPVILTQPASTSGVIGGSAEFAVTATGTDLLYQWYHNGAPMPGATSPTLVLTNLQREDGGSYQVVVVNQAESVPSTLVTLTGANPPPVVQPAVAMTSAPSGGSAQLIATASGAGTLTYQWRHFGVAIPGATGASLVITPATMADAGLYDVVVFDGLSQTTSNATRLLVSPSGGYPDTLRLDTTFAPLFETAWASIEDGAVAPSGEVYAVGNYSTIAGQRRFGVANFDPTLSLDPAFAPVFDDNVYAVLVQPDGKVIVGGSFTRVNGVVCNRIARLNPNGTVDSLFIPGTGFSGTVWTLARQSNGQILVGGSFYSVNGVARSSIARLNPDGSLDLSFGSASGPNGTVSTLAVQAGDKVLIGGSFNSVAGVAPNNLARLNSDGSLDTSFAIGTGFNNSVESLAVQDDGHVVVGGYFTSFNGAPCNRIARIDGFGSLDATFVTGTGFNSTVNAVAVLTGGRIAVSGWFYTYNGTPQQNMSVLTADGAIDGTFVPTARPSSSGYVIVPQAGGRFILGGYFSSVGATAGSGLVQYTSAGEVESLAAAGFRQLGSVTAAVPVAGGKWVVGGSFSHVNGTACGRIARLNADGSLDPAYAVGGGFNSDVTALAVLGDGRLLAAGHFSAFNGTVRNRIARLNADGSLDTTFDPGLGFNSAVQSLAVQADGRIVAGGYFTTFNGTARNYIARLTASGALDATFVLGTGFNSSVSSVVVPPDGKVVATGYFTSFNGTTRNYLARLNADGTLDAAFNSGSGFNSNVYGGAVLLADGRMLVGGGFNAYSGTMRSRVAMLNSDGSLDSAFNPSASFNNNVYGVGAQADGRVVVGGGFTAYGSAVRNYFARLNGDGTLDNQFTAFDLTSGNNPASLQYTDEGRLLLTGFNATRGTTVQRGLVMLKADASPAAAITVQPVTQAAAAGDTVTFSVGATGEGLLSYQWFKNGSAISGATGNSLVLTNVQFADVAGYSVTVSNGYGSMTSGVVTITGPNPVPSITAQPGVVTAVSGTTANLTVEATGMGLTYQWRRLGAPIVGATGATLTVASVTMADAGFYDVVISSGGFSTVTSQPALLVVSPSGGYPDTLRMDSAFAPLLESDMNATIRAVVRGPDGEYYVAGGFTVIGGIRQMGVARFNADLTLDTSFAPVLDGYVNSIALQTDGKLLIGGSFSTVDGVACGRIARLDRYGVLDPEFVTGTGFNSSVSALALQPDDKVLVSGNFVEINGVPRARLARLEPDGSVDLGFDTAASFAGVTSFAVQPNKAIVIGGSFSTTINSINYRSVARLLESGAIDPSFSTVAKFNSGVQSIVLQLNTDDTVAGIVVGGSFSTYGSTARGRIARLNADGTLDTAFAALAGFAHPTSAVVNSLALDSDGRILVGGQFSSFDGVIGLGNVCTLGSNGSLHSAVLDSAGPVGRVFAAVPLTGGGCVAGGAFQSVGLNAPTLAGGLAVWNELGVLKEEAAPPFRTAGAAYATLPLRDGRMLIGGNFTHVDGSPANNIARLEANGTPDAVFVPGAGLGGGPVYDLAIDGAGRIYAAGSFTTVDGVSRNRIARLLRDGPLDSSFDPGLGVTGSVVYDIVLQPDGRVLLGGEFTAVNGVARNRVARLNINGSLDASFDPGTGASSAVRSLCLLRTGEILLGGNFTTYNGVPRNRIARLLPWGVLDTAFDPGTGFNSSVYSVREQLDGKLVVAGAFTTYNGTTVPTVARLHATGSRDPEFLPVLTTTRFAYSAMPFPDGDILAFVVGTVADGTTSRNFLARFNANGSLDPSFAAYDLQSSSSFPAVLCDDGGVLIPGGTAARDGATQRGLVRLVPGTDPAPVITAQPVSQTVTLGQAVTLSVTATGEGTLTYQWRKQGVAIAGATSADYTIPTVTLMDAGSFDVVISNGSFSTISQVTTLAVAPPSYGTTFRLDPTFTPRFERQGAGITTLAVSDSGESYIVGTFTTLDGQRRDGFARLTAAAGLDASFNPVVNGKVSTVLPLGSSGWVLIGGNFTEVNGVPCYGLARISVDGMTVDPTFNPVLMGSGIGRIVQQPDGKLLLVGNFTDHTNLQLVRINADGSLDPTWAPAGTGPAWPTAMAMQTDGKIVIATTKYNGLAVGYLVRLNADGTLDSTFATGTGFTNDVAALAIQPDGMIVAAGSFTTYNGTACNNLARLNSDGTLDSTLSAGTGVSGVTALLLQPDGKLVLGGSFTTYNGVACSNLVRVSATGALDTSFATGTLPNGNVTTLGYDALNSQVVVGGAFTALGTTSTSGLARYHLDGSLASALAPGGRLGAMVYAAVPAVGGDWVVAGDFTHLNGVAQNRIARLNSNGSVDAGFAVGSGFSDTVYALARTGDGKILAGGAFTNFNGTGRNGIARLNPDGTNDGTFSIGTGFGSPLVRYITVMRDGRIVAAGDFGTYNGATAKGIARLQRDGAIDSTFSGWSPDSFSPLSLDVDSSGRILTSSWWISASANPTLNGATGVRLNVDGTLNTVLSAWGSSTKCNGAISAYVVQRDGKVIVGGFFSDNGGTPRQDLVRINVDGSFDPNFGSPTENNGVALSLNLLPDGRLLGTGYMVADGVSRIVNRYLGDGRLDPDFRSFDLLQYGGIGISTKPSYTDDGRILVPFVSGQRDGICQYGLVMLRPEASPAPVIVTAPASQVAAPGATASFTVVATGEGPLSYQWSKNGVVLPGQTAATLTLAGITASDFGAYSVVVLSSRHGSARSTDALLSIGAAGGPAYRLLDYFHPLVVGNQWVYTGPNWGPDATHSRMTVEDLSRSVTCYDAAQPSQAVSQNVVSLLRSAGTLANGFTVAKTWRDYFTVESGHLVFQGDDESSTIEQWRVGGGVQIPVSLTLGESSWWSGRLLGDGVDQGPVNYGIQVVGLETVTVPAGTYVNSLHLRILMITNQPGRGYRLSTDDEWWAAGIGMVKQHRIESGGEIEDQELLSASVVVPTAPSIIVAPVGMTIASGETATLTVAAIGTAPLSYQWYVGDTGDTLSPVVDATAPTLTTPALTVWTRYWVRVASFYGSVDSPTALVEVVGGTMTLDDWTAMPGVPADQRGPLDTPAGDGVTNLMKFALGVPPMADARAHLPTPVVRQLPGQPRGIGLLFARNPDAQGIALALDVSSDLTNWLTVDSIEESFGVNPDGTVLVRLWEANPPNVLRRFARLKVEMVP